MSMNRIIINADDCGYSTHVNDHIRNAILAEKVTSSTIIPNMNDFEGALKLFADFRDKISFGIHLNLTEGEPLLPSPELLDFGFYKEEDGRVVFNGKRYRYRPLPSAVKSAIKAELNAQVMKLISSGVELSHIDSHHHIHTAPFILPIVLQVAKENSICRIRRAGDNFMGGSSLYKKIWMAELRHYDKEIKTTDHFWGADEFLSSVDTNLILNGNCVIELMTHPGGKYHPEEEKLILDYCFKEDEYELINFKQL